MLCYLQVVAYGVSSFLKSKPITFLDQIYKAIGEGTFAVLLFPHLFCEIFYISQISPMKSKR